MDGQDESYFAGLAENKCLERTQQGAKLLQVGEQEVAFGTKFRARVVLNIEVSMCHSCSVLISRPSIMTANNLPGGEIMGLQYWLRAGVLEWHPCKHVRRQLQWQPWRQWQAAAACFSGAAVPAALSGS